MHSIHRLWLVSLFVCLCLSHATQAAHAAGTSGKAKGKASPRSAPQTRSYRFVRKQAVLLTLKVVLRSKQKRFPKTLIYFNYTRLTTTNRYGQFVRMVWAYRAMPFVITALGPGKGNAVHVKRTIWSRSSSGMVRVTLAIFIRVQKSGKLKVFKVKMSPKQVKPAPPARRKQPKLPHDAPPPPPPGSSLPPPPPPGVVGQRKRSALPHHHRHNKPKGPLPPSPPPVPPKRQLPASLSRGQVASVIRRKGYTLDVCKQKYGPKIKRVVVGWRILGSGRATKVHVRSKTNWNFSICIEDAVSKWRFHRFSGKPIDISGVPFHFN